MRDGIDKQFDFLNHASHRRSTDVFELKKRPVVLSRRPQASPRPAPTQLARQHNDFVNTHQNTTNHVDQVPTQHVLKGTGAVGTKTRKHYRRFGLPKLSNWQQFRIFAAGGMFAAGMIVLGFYLGVSIPSHATLNDAETGEVQGMQVIQADDGSTIEVEEGINPEDIDRRPPRPIIGDIPKRLKIPSIGVNASIRSLGLTRAGALAVPNYLAQVGWYDQSAKPGSPGTIVMDGHFNGNGVAVFKNLHRLEDGSEILVERGDGEVMTYVVEYKESYSRNSVPMERVVGGDGKERLNIITCDGQWQAGESNYNDRLVVYAVRKQ